ncbi:hypothetical protein CHARACLAT_020471 [Characodon lateralis]|uniref:Uncharacterized protein n=1 Tax=Characodon lateralis TaxID=208331 RepID=A0ABU7EVL3_9TELE|nr:hypothetical protein [Characodon lateralis]
MPFRDLAFSDLKFYPDHFKFYLKQTKTKGPCFISIAHLDGPFSKPYSLLLSNVTKSAHPARPFLTPEEFLASWSLKFLGQTLFSAIFPLVSSQVTHSELG